MNAVRKKQKKKKTHQVVARPQDSLRGKAIDKRSMVTSPGQGAQTEQKNQIDGEKSHMVAAVVFISPLFSLLRKVSTQNSVCCKHNTSEVNETWNLLDIPLTNLTKVIIYFTYRGIKYEVILF